MVDTGTTTSSAEIPITEKAMSLVGSTMEYGSTQKRLYEGGFTKGASFITLDEAPLPGLQYIVPATITLTSDTYDEAVVSGVSTPLEDVVHFWVGNLDDISSYRFEPILGGTSIPIYFVDNITGIGPAASWFQLATCNASSVVGSYSATGGGVATTSFAASATVSASAATGSWLLTTSGTSTSNGNFAAADYIIVNPGQVNSEIRRIATVTATGLRLTSGFASTHATGETVYVFAREFAYKQTTPVNAAGGEAQTYFNMSLQVNADKVQRE